MTQQTLDSTTACNYIGCQRPAVYRADYRSKSWPKPVLRCKERGGRHDFTARLVDGRWKECAK